MKIAIIGAGNVGGALGKGWADKGHSISFGVPEPQSEKMQALLKSIGANARAGSVQDAAANAEIVVFASRGMRPKMPLSPQEILPEKS